MGKNNDELGFPTHVCRSDDLFLAALAHREKDKNLRSIKLKPANSRMSKSTKPRLADEGLN